MTAVAMAICAAPTMKGHSCTYSAIVCDESGRNLDATVFEADESLGVYIADFDLAALREYRARETWRTAYRRPEAYGLLIATDRRGYLKGLAGPTPTTCRTQRTVL